MRNDPHAGGFAPHCDVGKNPIHPGKARRARLVSARPAEGPDTGNSPGQRQSGCPAELGELARAARGCAGMPARRSLEAGVAVIPMCS